jgi:hypothetical protein
VIGIDDDLDMQAVLLQQQMRRDGLRITAIAGELSLHRQ